MAEPRNPEPNPPLAGDLPVRRPPVDAVAMAAVRARAERALFGAGEPARLGRYVLLGRIAGGGMGVVYGAYDPELHRKVALKRLHPRQHGAGGAHQRLLVEARALAKLDHTNVVKVHDVIPHDGEVVIVMELVEGDTLAVWERARARTWREIVEVYAQAGDGLAAAHGVDVVHRDFKPANVIVGADRRVRVLDFGLARFGDEAALDPTPAAAGAPAAPRHLELTATGDVVGTLGYSAPEVLEGERATPASDQFSFCVSLHRAVEGVAPFSVDPSPSATTGVGADPVARLAAGARAGVIAYADDGRRVPPWLRAAIARGLAADPARRHASMAELVALLRRPRGWKRWRGTVLVAAGGAGLIAAGLGAFAGDGGAPAARCDGGEAWADAAWDADRRALVDRALSAPRSPYVHEVHDRVIGALDRYRADAIAVRRGACVAHRRGERSDALYDRQMRCLDERRAEQAAAVQVLAEIDPARPERAVEVVAGMRPVAQCDDLVALQADHPPPATPAAVAELADVRGRLSQAAALERAGRPSQALEVAADAVARADRLDHPPAVVEAALVQARVLLSVDRCAEAIAPLRRAERSSLRHHLWPAAVEAAARRLYCESWEPGADRGRLLAEAAIFDALGADLPGEPFARPLLLNNVGLIEMRLDERASALRHFEAAREAAGAAGEPDLELTNIDKNLAMLTHDGPTRERMARRAWERLRDKLGPAHPLTLGALGSYAAYVDDPAVALPLATAACERYRIDHPGLRSSWIWCDGVRAALAAELGDTAQAIAWYRDVAALAADSDEPDAAALGGLASGHVLLAEGDPAGAVTVFERVVDRFGASAHWWELGWAAEARLGAGLAERARGRARAAATHLEAAIHALAARTARNEEVAPHRHLARARLALAAVLRDLGDRSDRPAALEAQARAFYARASQPSKSSR